MSVQPGSLDFLYYNGVLDHIPYEAYSAPFGAYGSVPINGEQYVNQAKQGLLYDTYTSPDIFMKSNTGDVKQGENYSIARSAFGYNNGVDSNADFELNAFGQEGKSIRESVVNGVKSTASTVFNAPTFIKGLVSGVIMVGTLACLLRGKKKPPVPKSLNKSFWSKINPKNWLKQKS